MPLPMDVDYDIPTPPTTTTTTTATTIVLFDGTAIVDNVVSHICDPRTIYVVGCSAWFTNRRIITALQSKKGVAILCSSELKVREHGYLDKLFKSLSTCYGQQPIRAVCSTNGTHIMHHKFLIGLDLDRLPIWLVNGSFNFTDHAVCNRENAMFLYDAHIMTLFYREFEFLYGCSSVVIYEH